MDPENPVVKLCVAGMKAEGDGDLTEARDLFRKAWAQAQDHFEQCIAAHYLARHQPTPEDTLQWNETALHLADRVGDERVQGFYPSLYLNLGHCHELLGHEAEAKRFYDLAAAHAQTLPHDRYGKIVRQGIGNRRSENHKNSG